MLESLLKIAALLFIGVPILKNAIGPFIIWRTQKISTEAKVREIEDQSAIHALSERFRTEIAELESLGFKLCFWADVSMGKNIVTIGTFLNHDGTEGASINLLGTGQSDGGYIEISQCYEDAPNLDVINTTFVGCYPDVGVKDVYYYPENTSIPELYSIFSDIAQRTRSDRTVTALSPYSLAETIARFIRVESDALCGYGLCHSPIGAAGERKLTFRGACTLSYRSANPGRWFWKRKLFMESEKYSNHLASSTSPASPFSLTPQSSSSSSTSNLKPVRARASSWKVIGFSIIAGVTLSLGANFYTGYRYAIDESISADSIDRLYGDFLDDVEALYEIDDGEELAIRVRQLESEVPIDLGIIELSQRDLGTDFLSYGVNYFGYYPVSTQHSYFYRNTGLRHVPGMMRGYVETEDGRKIDTLQYTRPVYYEGETLEIELLIDYQRLLELLGNSRGH